MEKKNQLYIGQVAKLLDISSNTLRFFDKEGVVQAKRAENGYRYYDDWDINFLIEYKKYRSFGLTVEDTKDILYEDSLISLQNRLEENEKKIEEKIRYDYMLLEYNRRYCDRLYQASKTFTVIYAAFLSSFKKAKVFSPTETRLSNS